MKIQAVLCPTDFSHCSEAAVEHASQLAAENNARLHLLHVVNESAAYCTEFTGVGFMPDMTQSIESESQRLLDAVSPTKDGVPFERRLLLGLPARAIVDYAEQHHIDLIVMGSHGHTGLSRIVMGSVAEAVVRESRCPVLTVKQPAVDNSIAGGVSIVASHGDHPTNENVGAKS